MNCPYTYTQNKCICTLHWCRKASGFYVCLSKRLLLHIYILNNVEIDFAYDQKLLVEVSFGTWFDLRKFQCA